MNKEKLDSMVHQYCNSRNERTMMFAVLGELATMHQRATQLEQKVALLERSKTPKTTKKPPAKKEPTE